MLLDEIREKTCPIKAPFQNGQLRACEESCMWLYKYRQGDKEHYDCIANVATKHLLGINMNLGQLIQSKFYSSVINSNTVYNRKDIFNEI